VRKLPIVSSRMTVRLSGPRGRRQSVLRGVTSLNAGRSTVRPQHPKEMNVRQPLEVVVFPFRVTAAGPEYAVFRRADDGCRQGVAGGVEDGEDLPAART
jgi:hypothetical protein